MSLLLDSHALVWYLLNDDLLPSSLKIRLEDPGERVVVSVASQWELMLKALAGKLRLPEPPERFFFDVPEAAGFRLLDVQPRHVQALEGADSDGADIALDRRQGRPRGVGQGGCRLRPGNG